MIELEKVSTGSLGDMLTCMNERKFQHKELAQGRWKTFTFEEQMANIGSEVERALELFDLTLEDSKHKGRFREIARTREAWVDFYANGNEYGTTEKSWRKYFLDFTFAARRNR